MTDGPGCALRPTYCGIRIAVKDRNCDRGGGSGYGHPEQQSPRVSKGGSKMKSFK